MLQDRMEASLKLEFETLSQKFSSLWDMYKDSEHKSGTTIFILRVLRDLRAELPKRPDLSSFGSSLVPELHTALASIISSEPISKFSQAMGLRKRVAARALWEGSPELPIFPSPSTFDLLHSITSSMASAGSDLWSPVAVNVAKQHICDQIVHVLRKVLESQVIPEPPKVNGHLNGTQEDQNESRPTADGQREKDEPTVDKANSSDSEDILIQSFFDTLILEHFLVSADSEGSSAGLVAVKDSLRSRADLTAASNERLQRAAQEYWKRTNLLFGLLT